MTTPSNDRIEQLESELGDAQDKIAELESDLQDARDENLALENKITALYNTANSFYDTLIDEAKDFQREVRDV